MQAACVMLCFTAPHAFSIYIQLNFRYQIFSTPEWGLYVCSTQHQEINFRDISPRFSLVLDKLFLFFSSNQLDWQRSSVQPACDEAAFAFFSCSSSPLFPLVILHQREMRFIIKPKPRMTYKSLSKNFSNKRNLRCCFVDHRHST